MTLEQLVTDLATSQRLRDAGFPQDTALVWGMDYQETTAVFTHEYARDTFPDFKMFCAAPTAGELEEWLMVVFGFREILTNFNPDDPHPERRYMVLGSVHKEQIVQHAYGATHIAAKAALVLEVAG